MDQDTLQGKAKLPALSAAFDAVGHALSARPSKAGEFTTAEAWNAYVAAFAARLKSPLKVTLTP